MRPDQRRDIVGRLLRQSAVGFRVAAMLVVLVIAGALISPGPQAGAAAPARVCTAPVQVQEVELRTKDNRSITRAVKRSGAPSKSVHQRSESNGIESALLVLRQRFPHLQILFNGRREPGRPIHGPDIIARDSITGRITVIEVKNSLTDSGPLPLKRLRTSAGGARVVQLEPDWLKNNAAARYLDAWRLGDPQAQAAAQALIPILAGQPYDAVIIAVRPSGGRADSDDRWTSVFQAIQASGQVKDVQVIDVQRPVRKAKPRRRTGRSASLDQRLGTGAARAAALGCRLPPVLTPPGTVASGTLPRALPGPASTDLGGIDFTSLELRYVADTGAGGKRGLRYAFRGLPNTPASDPAAGLQTAQQSSDAFFTWLALPPKDFWVNLVPNQPDRIIAPQLARTDAGRVMLEADLQLKKTVVGLMNPDAPAGDAFWDELEALYGGVRALQSCVTFRVWIVPALATVRATKDELYILDAPLTIRAQSNPPGTVSACPGEDPGLELRKEELLARSILPLAIQAVNAAPEYAALRRVYLSRVASEWFRQRSERKRTAISGVVNSGNVDRWIARPAWDPVEVFNRYVQSYTYGEWLTKRNITVGKDQYVRTLALGGVDFSQVPRRNVSRREFRAKWPGLASRISESRNRPSANPEGTEIWLGGSSRRR